jgi:hypothetical protein
MILWSALASLQCLCRLRVAPCLHEDSGKRKRGLIAAKTLLVSVGVNPVPTFHERGLEKQRVAYREYVESALGEVSPESPMERVAGGLLLGSAGWVEKMRKLLKGNRTEQKAFRRLEKRLGWQEVRKAVEKVKGESWDRFAHRHGDWGRDLAFCDLTL